MNVALIRTRWAAVGAAVAITLGAGGIGITQATTSSGPRAIYTPINPCRLADLRPAPNTVGPRTAGLGPDETYTLDGWGTVGDCNLPTGTSGLALNVTAVTPTAPTFLRLWPAGEPQPTTSNLNPAPGQPPTPNAVNVGLSATGEFSVFNRFGVVNVIIDVVGVYDDHNHDDRYYQKPEVDAALDGAVKSDDGKSAYAFICTNASTQGIGVVYNVTDNCDWSFNPSGDPVTVERTALGVYIVQFPGLEMSRGHVQVTGYGTTNTQCKTAGWSSSAVDVRCYDPTGAPKNGPFTVLAVD